MMKVVASSVLAFDVFAVSLLCSLCKRGNYCHRFLCKSGEIDVGQELD